MPQEVVERTIERQREEIERRIDALRGGKPLPRIAGRTVILVDDGIAMGSTMRAAIKLARKQGAGKVVAAAPVTGQATQAAMAVLVDDLIILETPRHFRAVAQVYENWYDVPDSEVVAIMRRWQREREKGSPAGEG